MKHLFFACAFIGTGFMLGGFLLQRVTSLHMVESFALSVALGWGLLCCILMALGFCGILYAPVVFSAVLVTVSVGLVYLSGKARTSFMVQLISAARNLNTGSKIVALFFILYAALLFWRSLFPVSSWDALSYHLPVAKEYLARGKITILPYLRFPSHPQMIEMLFSLALLWQSETFASITQFAMALIATLLVYAAGRRYLSRYAGLFSGAAFLCVPVVAFAATTSYVEIGTLLFCASASYMVILGVQEKKLYFMLRGGFFSGVALGCKYYAVIYLMLAWALTELFYLRSIRHSHMALGIFVAVLVALPWYLHSRLATGDWFFPALAKRLPQAHGIWDAADVQGLISQMHTLGMGRGFGSFIMLPVHLLRYPERFGGEATLGPFSLLFLGCIFFVNKWKRPFAVTLSLIVCYGWVWFSNFQEKRYLFPILPLMLLAGAWTLENLRILLKKVSPGVFWLPLIVIVFMLSFWKLTRIIGFMGNVPVTAEERYSYLKRRIPAYPAVHFLNELKEKNVTIYSFHDERLVFYSSHKLIGDYFGPAAYCKVVFPNLTRPVSLRNVLQKFGVRYLLITEDAVDQDAMDGFIKGPFEIVYKDAHVTVLKLLEG